MISKQRFDLMYVDERQGYHLIDDIWFSAYKILKIRFFAGGTLVTIIFGTGISLDKISQK